MTKKIKGLVYFTPKPDGTGEIRAISYSPLTDEICKDWKVAEFNAKYLVDTIGDGRGIERFSLLFQEDGTPLLHEQRAYVPVLSYETGLRLVPEHDDLPGLSLRLDSHGKMKACLTVNRINIPYPDHQYFHVYFTKLDDPNILLEKKSFQLHVVMDKDYGFSEVPWGLPGTDYSLWAETPGPELPVSWEYNPDV